MSDWVFLGSCLLYTILLTNLQNLIGPISAWLLCLTISTNLFYQFLGYMIAGLCVDLKKKKKLLSLRKCELWAHGNWIGPLYELERGPSYGLIYPQDQGAWFRKQLKQHITICSSHWCGTCFSGNTYGLLIVSYTFFPDYLPTEISTYLSFISKHWLKMKKKIHAHFVSYVKIRKLTYPMAFAPFLLQLPFKRIWGTIMYS